MNQLRKLRVEKGLTQRQLAAKAKVHDSTISYLETEQRGPSPLVAARIAKALKHEVEDVFPSLDGKVPA